VSVRARPDPARLDGLHVLADDGAAWRLDPVEIARAACAGGAAVVQLRAKRAGDRDALAWARAIRKLTRASETLFIVNDRFDLALAAEADGVHLGQDDLPPDRIPDAERAGLLVGLSTHDADQARAAAEAPVDYVAFGPIFGTTSKHSQYAARGLALLGEVAAWSAPRPLVAIGGIDPGNAGSVIRTGARACAVIGAVAGAEDPARATADLVRALESGRDA
jgi:thiamine-phosphate pyrophosphorylase